MGGDTGEVQVDEIKQTRVWKVDVQVATLAVE